MKFTCNLNDSNFLCRNFLRASLSSSLMNFRATSSKEFCVCAYISALSRYLKIINRKAHKIITTHYIAKKKLFLAFPWVETSTGPRGFMIWVFFYYMTGTPQGSTESGFMEKSGIEPATPGLQGIALIHYTTGVESSKFPKS